MDNTFTAIRYPLSIDGSLSELGQERQYSAYVEQLIKQVLLTSPGERINRPDFGCGLRQMVFAPLADVTESLTRITVLQALNRWLGDLIRVEEVQTEVRDEMLEVGIVYRLLSRQERRYLNVEVTL